MEGTIAPLNADACRGKSVQLQATGGGDYRWYDTPDFSTAASLDCNTCANPVSSPDIVGMVQYSVIITSPEGCIDTLQTTLNYLPLPDIQVLPKYSRVRYGSSVQLQASGGSYYVWSPTASLDYSTQPDPVASPIEPTYYKVIGFDKNGCTNSDSAFVDIDFENPLSIPSVFTPNGDGKNDYFRVLNLNFLKLVEFQVLNRWGNIVFSTDDPALGWDGRFKGVPQELGVYYYTVRAAGPDGKRYHYKGDVTLVR